jgi:D-alanine-D-alanine ligase
VRVLQLTGSAVSDFYGDLSRLYARGCLATAATLPWHEMHLADVSPDGRWRFPAALTDTALAAAEALPLPDALDHLAGLGLDVMVPQMFCRPGMTHYRALFDVLGVPYVGNPPDVMALAADKARAKAVVAAAGVDVPAGEVLRRGQSPTLPPPAVVKPADADNSHGVSLVRSPDAYADALEAAFAHTDTALVETYVELGREVRCGVIVRDGELVCLPLEEYAVDHVRNASDKLARDEHGDLGLVAKEVTKAWIVDADDPVTDAVHAAARRCHHALGCRDYSLFDFRVDPAGRPYFLEAGPYCSYAEQSVISTMARAAGISTPRLLDEALTAARAR